MKTAVNMSAVLLYIIIILTPALAHTAQQAVIEQKILEKYLYETKHSTKLQTKMPQHTAPEEKDITTPTKPFFNIDPQIMRYLLYISIIIIIAITLYSLRGTVWSNSKTLRHKKTIDKQNSTTTSVDRMEKALAEADIFASQGNITEAMHLLLLKSVNELRNHLKISISTSLTSREILYSIKLPNEGGKAFAKIVKQVELSYYGTYQPNADDFTECRQNFDILTNILKNAVVKQ